MVERITGKFIESTIPKDQRNRSYADREPQAYFAQLAEHQAELRKLYAIRSKMITDRVDITAIDDLIRSKKVAIRGYRLSANSVYGKGV